MSDRFRYQTTRVVLEKGHKMVMKWGWTGRWQIKASPQSSEVCTRHDNIFLCKVMPTADPQLMTLTPHLVICQFFPHFAGTLFQNSKKILSNFYTQYTYFHKSTKYFAVTTWNMQIIHSECTVQTCNKHSNKMLKQSFYRPTCSKAIFQLNNQSVNQSINQSVSQAQTPLIRFVVQLVVRLVVMLWICCKWGQGGLTASRPTTIFRQQAGDLITWPGYGHLPRTFPRLDNSPPFYME